MLKRFSSFQFDNILFALKDVWTEPWWKQIECFKHFDKSNSHFGIVFQKPDHSKSTYLFFFFEVLSCTWVYKRFGHNRFCHMSHVTVLDDKQNHFLLSPQTQRIRKRKRTIEPGNTVLTNEFGTQTQDRRGTAGLQVWESVRLARKIRIFFRFLERLEI